MAKDISCEITRTIAIMGMNDKGFSKEINLVSWNGAEPKYDIRTWHPEREKCGKGIALTRDEAIALMYALIGEFGEQEENDGEESC